MTSVMLAPPVAKAEELPGLLQLQGYAVMNPEGLAHWLKLPRETFAELNPFWDQLPPDRYLRDGGHYRRRRHSCFISKEGVLLQSPHRAHWQPLDYNALHGGIERWFEPIDAAMIAKPVWTRLLQKLVELATALKGSRDWFIEAHPFRIDTHEGIGRPTPEGAHRDGVDLVAVILVDRYQIKGGETRVFEANGSSGLRFTMTEPWTILLLDDARVIHESTPIQPETLEAANRAHRDTLVVTLRADSFQQA